MIKTTNISNSKCSQNEFISNQLQKPQQFNATNNNQQISNMFIMFQKMANDPSLFMKVMNSVKNNQNTSQNRKRQFQVQQHKYRSYQISPQNKETQQLPIPSKEERKKGTDVIKGTLAQDSDQTLSKYCPLNKNPSENNSNLHHFQSNPIEDRPIKSSYISKQQQPSPLNSKQFTSIHQYIQDQRPIAPAKTFAYDNIEQNQSQIINNSMTMQADQNKYKLVEDRPIKGINCDFKEYVMTQQGLPISQYPDQQQYQRKEKAEPPKPNKPKQFLKRKSRQFLSSAKNRQKSKQNAITNKKNIKQNLNTSINNSIKDQKSTRSISQNRILGKNNVSSKSIHKKINQNNQDHDHDHHEQRGDNQKKFGQHSYPNLNHKPNREDLQPTKQQKNNKNKKQSSVSPRFRQQSHSPKPKKNIFEQSNDSNSDQQNKNCGSNNSSSIKQQKLINANQFKNQVIPGVYLSKKQLNLILTKYGNNNSDNSSDLKKIQEIKNKYTDLSNLLAYQKQQLQQTIKKQKQQFEIYKQSELQKIKNEKKIQDRNIHLNQKIKQKQKQKQDFDLVKKLLEKQRQQFKHRQKNYKIIIDKLKKDLQEKNKTGNHLQHLNNNNNNNSNNSNNNSKKKQKPNKKSEELYSQDVSGHADNRNEQQNIECQHDKKDYYIINSTSGVKQNSKQYNKQHSRQHSKQMTKQLPKQNLKQPGYDRDRLPNYSDLKKINPPKLPPQDNQNKNKKYDYYEQLQNKQTVKNSIKFPKQNDDDNQPQIHSDKQQQDRQQIVEYNPSMKLSDLSKITLNIKMVTDEMIQNLFRYNTNPQYLKYLSLTKSKQRTKIHTSRNSSERKTTNTYSDGSKQIIFDTGVKKQYLPNGYVITFFNNGDIKQKLADDTILYFYQKKFVDQITLPNKINIYRFNNNQVQFHFSDEQIQIRHPDGTFKIL